MTNGKKKKPGSGRKTSSRSVAQREKTLKRATAEEILGVQDECELWDRLLHSEDDRVAFAALKYLTDRRDGKLYPAANGSFGDQSMGHPGQFRGDDGPRLADPKIAVALNELLPPPSPQVTVGDRS